MNRYRQVLEFVVAKLEAELPPHITYHNIKHTRNVLEAVEILAKKECVGEADLHLLKVGALFHDIGFVKSHIEHEELSCEIAREDLPGFGYTDEQITKICKMIMATKLPQQPTDELSKILCDADLYYLGGEDYDKYAENLYTEFTHNKIVDSREQWLLLQEEFLATHKYFTKSGRKNRRKGKLKKLKEIQSSFLS